MNVPPLRESAQLREADRCPHCGGLTVLAPNRALRWVCGACGGPRIPGWDGAVRKENDAIVRDLVLAHRARVARVGWGIAAIVLFLSAFGALLATLIAFLVSHLAGAILLPIVLLFGALAVIATRRTTARSIDAKRALDEAWTGAAARIVETHGGVTTAAALARTMHLTEPEAEVILSTLSSTDRARIDVGDDAELRYRVISENNQAMDEAQERPRAARES